MRHNASSRFWKCFRQLPNETQRAALKNYRLLVSNPKHPSLQFKKVGTFWSARATLGYRALAVECEDGLVWVWIGSHGEYDRLIK